MKQFIIRICQVLCVLVLVMGIGFGLIALSRTTSAISSDSQTPNTTTNTISASTKTVDMNALSATIEELIQQSDLEVGVSAINLSNNNQANAGESAAFLAASTTKVLTAAYYMHQVEQGSASLSTTIGGTTAQSLIQRMLNKSDNAAWATLNDYLGKSNLQTYAEQLGLSSYDSTANTITASDQAKLLAALQSNKLANKAHTTIMLSFMQNTNNETLIPAALPSNATTYHKYGQLYGELHDSAIVTYGDTSFVLVIFTKSSSDTITDLTTRTQLFHAITEAATTAFGVS